MRSIRRRDSGEGYRAMLTRMAEDSGIATPTAAELKPIFNSWYWREAPKAADFLGSGVTQT
jgi:hypothetical protein